MLVVRIYSGAGGRWESVHTGQVHKCCDVVGVGVGPRMRV
jgi:hypothetical protein